jgi:hypothetical protein
MHGKHQTYKSHACPNIVLNALQTPDLMEHLRADQGVVLVAVQLTEAVKGTNCPRVETGRKPTIVGNLQPARIVLQHKANKHIKLLSLVRDILYEDECNPSKTQS